MGQRAALPGPPQVEPYHRQTVVLQDQGQPAQAGTVTAAPQPMHQHDPAPGLGHPIHPGQQLVRPSKGNAGPLAPIQG